MLQKPALIMQDASKQATASDPLVQEIIQEQVTDLLQGGSLADYCLAYAHKHAPLGLLQRVAAAESLSEVHAGHKSQAVQLLLAGLQVPGVLPDTWMPSGC